MNPIPHLCLAAACLIFLVLAPCAVGQEGLHSPAFLFDDFTYAVEEAEVGRAGSLFGRNAWLVADGDALVVDTARAWYAQEWIEGGPNYASNRGTGESGFSIRTREGYLELRAQAGRLVETDAYVRSGFAQAAGTWVVRARLSGPPPMNDGRGVSEGSLDTYAPLWLQSANAAVFDRHARPWFTITYTSPDGRVSQKKGWFEANFELWNPRRATDPACVNDPDRPACVISTGVTWWANTRAQRNPYLRSTTWSRYPGCRVGRASDTWREGTNLGQQGCYDLLTSGRLWGYFIIRVTDTRTSHYIIGRAEDEAADGPLGYDWLHMETGTMDGQAGGAPHFIPPPPMRTTLSMKVSTGDRPLADDMLTQADWFYYTPNTEATLDDILADVARIRRYGEGRGDYAGRINTTGMPVQAPLLDEVYDRTRYAECTWAQPFEPMILGPFRSHDPQDEALYFSGRQNPGADNRGLRQTTYRVTWDVTEVYDDGTTYTDTRDRAGYQYVYTGPRLEKQAVGVALERLELTLTMIDLEQVNFNRSARCPTDPHEVSVSKVFERSMWAR